jgi:hypothetical protein
MTRQSLIRFAAGATLAGMASLAAVPALAATSSSPPGHNPSNPAQTADLGKVQAAAKKAIDDRVAALKQVITVLQGTSYLGGDQQTLVATAQSDVSALTNLETTIQADTTVQQAKADAETIFTGYRVFALVLPVDHMVRASDDITGVIVPKLTALETKWAALNVSAIASLLNDMQTQTQAAAQAVAGLPGQLEGFTPSAWNSNHGLLGPARTALGTARTDLEKARADAKQIHAILKAQKPQKAATSTSTAA